MRGARRHAGWLSHIVDDLNDEDEGGLIIIEEGRVRLVMPVMVEADCDDDTVTRVVTLPEEIREGRDDRSPGEPAERAGGGGGAGRH